MAISTRIEVKQSTSSRNKSALNHVFVIMSLQQLGQ